MKEGTLVDVRMEDGMPLLEIKTTDRKLAEEIAVKFDTSIPLGTKRIILPEFLSHNSSKFRAVRINVVPHV